VATGRSPEYLPDRQEFLSILSNALALLHLTARAISASVTLKLFADKITIP
jgi:hypothetical protein